MFVWGSSSCKRDYARDLEPGRPSKSFSFCDEGAYGSLQDRCEWRKIGRYFVGLIWWSKISHGIAAVSVSWHMILHMYLWSHIIWLGHERSESSFIVSPGLQSFGSLWAILKYGVKMGVRLGPWQCRHCCLCIVLCHDWGFPCHPVLVVFSLRFDMLLDLLGSFIYCHSFSNLCALGVCYVTMLLVVGHSSDLIYARNIPKYAFDSFMNNTMPGPQLPVGVCWLFLECCFCCQLQIVKITISRWRCFAGAGLFGCDTGQLRDYGFASNVWRFTKVMDTMWMQQKIVWATGIPFWKQLVVLLLVVVLRCIFSILQNHCHKILNGTGWDTSIELSQFAGSTWQSGLWMQPNCDKLPR